MKVYLLRFDMGYDCDYKLGIFSTREKAEKHKNQLISEGELEEDMIGGFIIDDYELDVGLYPIDDKEVKY
ncbi:MAG: hypothetical protein JRD89_01040 [Deltaproteobacteria bacterium]|nr:hypothetical protein [Deltaproteobacteria bacterium]